MVLVPSQLVQVQVLVLPLPSVLLATAFVSLWALRAMFIVIHHGPHHPPHVSGMLPLKTSTILSKSRDEYSDNLSQTLLWVTYVDIEV